MPKEPVMEIEDLKLDPGYLDLTSKQQAWVIEFLTNGNDWQTATEKTQDCKNKKTARVFGRQFMQKATIRRVVDKYYGSAEPSQAEFCRMLWNEIDGTKSGKEKLAAMAFYAKLQGWDKPAKAAARVSRGAKMTKLLNEELGR